MAESREEILKELKKRDFKFKPGLNVPAPGVRDTLFETEVLKQCFPYEIGLGVFYAKEAIQGRWKEFETRLISRIKSLHDRKMLFDLANFILPAAIEYCTDVINGRWPQLEGYIFRLPEIRDSHDFSSAAYSYAKTILKRYCTKGDKYYGGELTIEFYLRMALRHPGYATLHATDILNRRFENPYIEYLITCSPWVMDNYCRYFRIEPEQLKYEAVLAITKYFEIEDFLKYTGFLIEYCRHILKGRFYDIEPMLKETDSISYYEYVQLVIENPNKPLKADTMMSIVTQVYDKDPQFVYAAVR